MNPILVDEKDAAELLGLTRRTLQKWRTDGRGPPHVKISQRCVRYRVEDIEEWIESKLRTSTSDVRR